MSNIDSDTIAVIHYHVDRMSLDELIKLNRKIANALEAEHDKH